MTALREVESESAELIDLLETKERFRGVSHVDPLSSPCTDHYRVSRGRSDQEQVAGFDDREMDQDPVHTC